jgi:hypothetical protein
MATDHGFGTIVIASLRFPDAFAKIDRACFFADRKPIVDWSETGSMRGQWLDPFSALADVTVVRPGAPQRPAGAPS